jgi:hypothetical protein
MPAQSQSPRMSLFYTALGVPIPHMETNAKRALLGYSAKLSFTAVERFMTRKEFAKAVVELEEKS